ncbi:MAG TPA: dihydroorotase, partial [Noviherbaspirillum sp.]
CIIDPNVRWKVEPKALASQGKHTPFAGYELSAQVQATLVGGRIAFRRS